MKFVGAPVVKPKVMPPKSKPEPVVAKPKAIDIITKPVETVKKNTNFPIVFQPTVRNVAPLNTTLPRSILRPTQAKQTEIRTVVCFNIVVFSMFVAATDAAARTSFETSKCAS